MRDLNYGLRLLSNRNHDGSHATRSNRERNLSLMANQLYEQGYKDLKVHQLGGRHVTALVQRWADEGLATGTIKNRMSALRWWAEKVNRASVVARDNSAYGIADRVFVTNESKAKTLGDDNLLKIQSPEVALSLRLQQQFGLRREEAIKFRVSYADKGDRVSLKGSWTKGGRSRDVPVNTPEQRQLLNELHAFCGKGSLIPQHLMYVQQKRIYERQCINAGLNKMHGLRHAYAQARYEKLTGWRCRAAGGPPAKELTPEQRALDREVRLVISAELGHEREDVTAQYLGR
jgi:site-specific recombinase XerC